MSFLTICLMTLVYKMQNVIKKCIKCSAIVKAYRKSKYIDAEAEAEAEAEAAFGIWEGFTGYLHSDPDHVHPYQFRNLFHANQNMKTIYAQDKEGFLEAKPRCLENLLFSPPDRAARQRFISGQLAKISNTHSLNFRDCCFDDRVE